MEDFAHDEIRDAAGPWVLGALDDDEAWRFSAHLEVCQSCQDEVRRLRVAAAALPLAVPLVEAPPALKARLMNIVQAEAAERSAAPLTPTPAPRWRMWFGALRARPALAAGLAALLLVAGVAGFAARGGDTTHTSVAKVDQRAAPGGRAELVQGDSGDQLRVANLPPPARGHVYQAWVTRRGQQPTPDAVFTVDRQGRGSVALRSDADGAEQVMVTQEPDGGSRAPSSVPIVVVRPA